MPTESKVFRVVFSSQPQASIDKNLLFLMISLKKND